MSVLSRYRHIDFTRRHFLRSMSTGLTGVALSNLLTREILAAPQRQPHFAPKAKQVLQIFCPGAASHIDLWDHKPMLEKFHDTPMPGADKEVTFQGKNGNFDEVSLAIRSSRQKRQNDLDDAAAHVQARRRYRLHPQHDLAHQYARPRLHQHELLLYPRRLPQRRIVGQFCAWLTE